MFKPLLEGQKCLSKGLFKKILVLCTVSIQKRFLIKSRLGRHIYHSLSLQKTCLFLGHLFCAAPFQYKVLSIYNLTLYSCMNHFQVRLHYKILYFCETFLSAVVCQPNINTGEKIQSLGRNVKNQLNNL